MKNIKKLILSLAFCLFIVNNNLSYAIVSDKEIDNHIASLLNNQDKLMRHAKSIGKVAKYGALAISAVYAVNGFKKTIESIRSIVPVDEEFKITDLLKFPFRLLAFPFKVIDIGRCFFISGGLGMLSYALHKAGM